ncbi:HNH endonuclease, partial [Hominenteromicrobium sp.]
CICSYCGNQILSIDDCEVDHIIPYDKGGPTVIENAQLLHRSCNRSKGNRVINDDDFIDDSDDETDI